MKMRKKKDELYETAEISLLATRMKELGRKSNLFIDEAMNVFHCDRMEDYLKIIAEGDDLIHEYEFFVKCNTIR